MKKIVIALLFLGLVFIAQATMFREAATNEDEYEEENMLESAEGEEFEEEYLPTVEEGTNEEENEIEETEEMTEVEIGI